MIVAVSADVNQVIVDMDAVRNSSGILINTFIGLAITVFLAQQVFRIIRGLFP